MFKLTKKVGFFVAVALSFVAQPLSAQSNGSAFETNFRVTIARKAVMQCEAEVARWGASWGFGPETYREGIKTNSALDYPGSNKAEFEQRAADQIKALESSSAYWGARHGPNTPEVLHATALICALRSALVLINGQSPTSTSAGLPSVNRLSAASVPPGVNPNNPWYRPGNSSLSPQKTSWVSEISVPAGEDLRKACAPYRDGPIQFMREAGFTQAYAESSLENRLRQFTYSASGSTPAQVRRRLTFDFEPGSEAARSWAKYNDCLASTAIAQNAGKRGIPAPGPQFEAWEKAQATNEALRGLAITPMFAARQEFARKYYEWHNSELDRKGIKLHNAANDATECLTVLPTGTKLEWGTSGKYKMVNTCAGRVSASWCANQTECNAGQGNLWTLLPGQEWPIYSADPANPYIRVGACKVDNLAPLPSDAAISRQGGINTRHNDPPAAGGVEKLPGHICE